MSDQDRLSHARNVEGLHSEPSSLDNQAQSNSAFNQAASNSQNADAVQGRNSEMVKKDGSRHNMRPPEDVAHAKNSRDFDKAWTGEQRAAARINELRSRYSNQPQDNNQSDQQNFGQRSGQKL